MEKYYGIFLALSGLLLLGLIVFVIFNIKEKKSGEGISQCLKFRTASYLSFLVVFAYYIYWLINADALRMMFAVFLGAHAVLVLLLCFASAGHAHKSDNLPGGIRATLITFVVAHLAMPAFPSTEQSAYVIFKLFNNATAATIGLMITVFLLVINLILMVAQLVMFFRARRF